jgi:hypothetical protein
VNITSHTPELGGPWVLHPSYGTGFTVDAATDRVFSAGVPAANYLTVDPLSPNYYVAADFYLHSAESQNVGICARMEVGANTMYFARLNMGTTWELTRILAGSQVIIGSSTNEVPTAGKSRRGILIAVADELRFYVGAVLAIGPITDTNILAAGKVGIRNSGAITSTTGVHLDNLEAGLVSVAKLGSLLRPAIFRPGLAR